MKSMTGYGKCQVTTDEIQVTVEIKTLNSKNLRIRPSIPRLFNPFINEINTMVGKFLKRGDVDIHVNYRLSPEVSPPLFINYTEAKKFIKAVERISGISGKDIQVTLKDLLSIPEIFQKEEVDPFPFKEPFLKALECALVEVVRTREEEGEKLKSFFVERLEKIEITLNRLKSSLSNIERLLQERLREKVKKLLKEENLSEEFEKRVELEVVLLAEKQDVSEEISRLETHIERFRKLLESEEPVGKELDFLCQEMHREINTLGSKVKEVDITEPVLDIKSEIAKIKEQVQNVE